MPGALSNAAPVPSATAGEAIPEWPFPRSAFNIRAQTNSIIQEPAGPQKDTRCGGHCVRHNLEQGATIQQDR
ncbi:Transferase [Penicillium lividum]|nr:Transferase [Penicillium lividum]